MCVSLHGWLNDSKKVVILPCGHLICLECQYKRTIRYFEHLINTVNNGPQEDMATNTTDCSCPKCRSLNFNINVKLERYVLC